MYYVLLFVMLGLYTFFSVAETAFSSVNLIRLRQYVEEGRPGAKAALKVAEQFDQVLVATLLCNNIANSAAVAVATVIALDLFGASGVTIVTLALTIFITIFSEMVPKTYAKKNSERSAIAIGRIYTILLVVLKPVIKILIFINAMIERLYKNQDEVPSVTEDELNVIIDTMEEEGILEEDEVDMLQGVLDLSETFVRDIMTPRVDVVAIDVNASVEEITAVFLEEKYSRVPVYENSRDNILGVLYERDLFSFMVAKGSLEAVSIVDLMREGIYVSDSMRVSTLLPRLQFEKQHLAIVVDEYGGTAGIVTMEDVLEEVVGEIYDEHDEEELLIIKKDDQHFEVKADIELDELFDVIEMDMAVPEDAHSLGSWIYSKIEDIPKVGDDYRYYQLLFTVIEVEGRRIKRVRIEIKDFEEVSVGS